MLPANIAVSASYYNSLANIESTLTIKTISNDIRVSNKMIIIDDRKILSGRDIPAYKSTLSSLHDFPTAMNFLIRPIPARAEQEFIKLQSGE